MHEGEIRLPVVLLVALDERARDECTALFDTLQPWPVVVAHHLGTAIEWMRATRPAAVLVGGTPSPGERQALRSIATEISAKTVVLAEWVDGGGQIEQAWRELVHEANAQWAL